MSKKKKEPTGPPKPVASWVEDDPVKFPGDENAEVVKLQVGESVEGEIVDIIESKKWPGRRIYKIQRNSSDKTAVILGTTVLDRLMTPKTVGDKVKIQRLQDLPSDKGNPTQNYKTFRLAKA